MGQVERITVAPHQSLSFIVEDLGRARREGLFTPLDDIQAWVNVLHDWSAPLVTESGRRGIEDWLDAVEADEIPA